MTDKERQLDEIEALKWIYPQELSLISEWPTSGYFKISPSLVEEELPVKIETISNGTSEERTIKVKYLPPIELYFQCPEDYPSTSQPMFMLNCCWLHVSKLTQICHHLDKLWDECFCSEVLFTWVSFLKEDCCSFLRIHDLHITLKVDSIESNLTKSMPDELLAKKKLQLKELRNKSNRNEFAKVNPRLRAKIKKNCNLPGKRVRSKETFKYETPKDLEVKVETVYPSVSGVNDSLRSNRVEDSTEKRTRSLADHILEAMPVYGLRSKMRSVDFDSRVVPNNFFEVPNVVNRITEYNDRCLDTEFRCQVHSCNICFENKLGSACVCVKPCRHAFCKDCFSEYLTVNIKESQVQKLQCLDPNCDTVLNAPQIKQNVDEATFQKYLKFSQKMLVQSDANLLYCPRKFCQGVAQLCDKIRAMGHCEQCNFYFCLHCNRSYHGIEMCKLKSEEIMKVIQEYQISGPVRKAELEKRYSKQQLMKWVEDDLTEKLLKKCSKPCPNCGVLIEKNQGCNKMLCFSCNVPFCWLCDMCLSHTVPYAHYQNKNSPCYEKLFPYEEENDDVFLEFEEWEDEYDFDEFDLYDEALGYFSDSD